MFSRTRWMAALAALGSVGMMATACGDGAAPGAPGIRVGAASGPTTEAGGRATLSVVLGAKPRADVTVHFGSSDTSEGLVQSSELTFTPDSWNTPQLVAVRGVDDTLRDGTQDYQVTFSTTTEDADYAALAPDAVTLSNLDDDTSGIRGELTGATNEARGQATLRVVLSSEPRADVTVDLRSTDDTEGTFATPRLTFSPRNWNQPQTVLLTGVDDEEADGPQTYAVELSSSSEDPDYAGLLQRLELANTDDDAVGVTAGPLSGPSTEEGGQAAFTVALRSRPTGPVTVDLVTSDPTEGTPMVATLSFTPDTWKVPQTVLVAGVDDAVADGDVPYSLTLSTITSEDPAYASLAPGTVLLTNTDDDVPGFLVTKPTGPTTEVGGVATFTVALLSEPLDIVTLSLESDDETEGTVSPKLLTFTPLDWKTPQKVRVKGVLDTIADGDQPYKVVFTPSVSVDPLYAGVAPPGVKLINTDVVGFCQPLDGAKCPTGATAWCSTEPLSAVNAAQAKAACEACYGKACHLNSVDCAGPAYGPDEGGTPTCGQTYFGFTSGCFGGQPGRTFPLCSSNTSSGRWAP